MGEKITFSISILKKVVFFPLNVCRWNRFLVTFLKTLIARMHTNPLRQLRSAPNWLPLLSYNAWWEGRMIEVHIKAVMALQTQLGGISGSRQCLVCVSLLQMQHPTSTLSFDSTLGCWFSASYYTISRFMIYLYINSPNSLFTWCTNNNVKYSVLNILSNRQYVHVMLFYTLNASPFNLEGKYWCFLLHYVYLTAIMVRIFNRNTEDELENMTNGFPEFIACKVSGVPPLNFPDLQLFKSAQGQKMKKD